MLIHRNLLSLFPWLTLLFLAGCTRQTHIVESWRAPDMEIDPGHYQKLLTVAMLQDDRNRRIAEDKLTELMPGRATPSYVHFEQLPSAMDEQQMMDMMRQEGYDGILIMRLISVEEDTTYIPGTYHGPYQLHQGQVVASPTYIPGTYPSHYAGVWSYYNQAFPAYTHYQAPGHFDVERYYYYETNLYDVEKNALVWSAVTSTYEPADMGRTASQVVDAVYREMVEREFVRENNGAGAR
jgi:hypothetical protein